MREVEGKLCYGDSLSVAELRDRMNNMGILIGLPSRQVDYVYTYQKHDLLEQKRGSVAARVRDERPGTMSLAVKRRREEDLDRDEYQVEILDVEAARALLAALGLTEVVVVRKVRRVGAIDSELTVCIDDVEHLGVFVEIEYRPHGKAASKRVGRILSDIQEAVGSPAKVVTTGYDRLLLKQAAGAKRQS